MSLVSTFYAKSASSSYHGWVTFRNFVSSSRNFCNCICNSLLLPDCTIRCIGVRLGVSSYSFAIFASAYRISSRTSSTTSICSMPNHDVAVVSSKCVVSSTQCVICPMISLAASFNCSVRSLFSSSSILALYSTSTISILAASACARTTTFYTFSNTEASGSSCMFGSSEHNSTTTLFKLTSSCFRCTTTVVVSQYLFSTLSRSYLSVAFSALTSYSLSLNSSTICTCRVLNVSEGCVAKSSCAAPSYSPSHALGRHMLIGVTETNRCRVPFGSTTNPCLHTTCPKKIPKGTQKIHFFKFKEI